MVDQQVHGFFMICDDCLGDLDCLMTQFRVSKIWHKAQLRGCFATVQVETPSQVWSSTWCEKMPVDLHQGTKYLIQEMHVAAPRCSCGSFFESLGGRNLKIVIS